MPATSVGVFLLGMALGAAVALLLGYLVLRVGALRKPFHALNRALLNSPRLRFLALPGEPEPEEFEQELLESVEEFGETIVREIMVPRVDAVTVHVDATLFKAMSVFLACGHSRLPVIEKSVDDIVGVLYLKDVARLQHENPKALTKLTAADLMRPARFVPDSKSVTQVMLEMQESATHIVVVVDEYGGVAGIASLEDVIEELIGEISDEYDRDLPDIESRPDGSLRVSARCSLFDLGEELDIELEDDEVDTVSGLVSKLLGRLPVRGDELVHEGIRITVDSVEPRRKRLVAVSVTRLAGSENEA